jgi:formate--tetrahydrofolate ligase
MAIFCLSQNLDDLTERLGNMVVAQTRERKPIYARDLGAHGAMAVLLKDAIAPNLVQTLENNPAFIHGGPFANIAHGCNSVIATKTALKLADYVVTEAGFGADLGAEKFFNIKCRKAGLSPKAAVIVATVRALKMHGGVAKGDLGAENVEAVRAGCANLARHIRNVKSFGVPAVVAINQFINDTQAEIEAVIEAVEELGAKAIIASHWANGSAGTEELARHVVDLVEHGGAQFAPIYDDDMLLWDKVRTIATHLYGADDIIADDKVRKRFAELQEEYGHFPVCMAKTQYSFSTDPNLKGAPSHHVVPVREVRLSAGAGFLVVICGEIMTMPGLPRKPAANAIHLNEKGEIDGLF